MIQAHPLALIGIGFVLVLLGAGIPWLIVLGYIPSILWLDLLCFTMSMAGLLLGMIGAFSYVGRHRRRE